MCATGRSACLKVLKGLGYLKQTCQQCAQALSCSGCVRAVAALTHPLSGAPCRLPPGSAGQRCAGLYILHPGHLRVCGSALHPQQRKEVHHLRRLSGPRLWVFFRSGVCPAPSISALTDVLFPPPAPPPPPPQACASWLQPPSTQTASTWMRRRAGMATATSWRGSPSRWPSSPPSLTLCYARRRDEKDTSLSSNQPWKTPGWIYPQLKPPLWY